MIVNLETIEKNFGHLWGHNQPGQKTQDQRQWYEVYLLCRELILNLGNKMMKNAAKEIGRYDILLNPYQYKFDLRNSKETKDE